MSKDILLGADFDIAIVDYDIAMTNSAQFTEQRIKQVLLGIQGEWFLDSDLGIPYYEDILGKNKDIERVRALFLRALQSIEQIIEITQLDITYNPEGRSISAQIQVRDIEDNIVSVAI